MGLLSQTRLSSCIATTASAPRGGGCWHIDRRERPRKTRLLLLVVNRPFERSSGGVPLASPVPLCPGERDASILNAETGGGAFAPSPSAPPPMMIPPRSSVWVYSPGYGPPRVSPRLPHPPVEIPPTVQCMGRGLKREPARGSTLLDTALLGYHHDCPRPRGGGGGGGGCRHMCVRP